VSGPDDAAAACSVAARRRQDELAGTAIVAGRFLLVEDPGPWGRPPQPVGSLPAAVVDHLRRQAREHAARLLLIRRTGRRSADQRERTWAFADLAGPVVRSGRAPSVAALAQVDVVTGGTVDTDPWYLVCTQGRHDVCCSVYGRPVVQALDAVAPDRTWECSHTGGDRFAANLLLLPTGLMYGWVDPAAALHIVAAEQRGAVVPAYLRGRCGTAPAAQVAEKHARTVFEDLSEGALRAVVVGPGDRGRWSVEVTHRPTGARVLVELVERQHEVPGGLTCASPGPDRRRDWELQALTALP
jgi:Sucrase/ferredoxin-like